MRIARLIAGLLVLCLPLVAGAAKKDRGKGQEQGDASVMQAETFKGLELRGIGPALMAGRIADIAIHPEDQSTWYVAAGSGQRLEDDQRRHGHGRRSSTIRGRIRSVA